jgi:hypothetical protein
MYPSVKVTWNCSEGKSVQIAKLYNSIVRNRKNRPSRELLNWYRHGTRRRYSEETTLLLKPQTNILGLLSSATLSEIKLGPLEHLVAKILHFDRVVSLPELGEYEIRIEDLGRK